jgi:hypothetical protein
MCPVWLAREESEWKRVDGQDLPSRHVLRHSILTLNRAEYTCIIQLCFAFCSAFHFAFILLLFWFRFSLLLFIITTIFMYIMMLGMAVLHSTYYTPHLVK